MILYQFLNKCVFWDNKLLMISIQRCWVKGWREAAIVPNKWIIVASDMAFTYCLKGVIDLSPSHMELFLV